MTKFICISGPAQSGKDTSAAILRDAFEKRGVSTLIIHYADLLKFICRVLFDWNGEKDTDGRTLLQRVGTDCVRRQNPNYWVDFVVNLIKMFPDHWDYVIVPDTRFPNEIERVKEAGLEVTHIRVFREEYEDNMTSRQRKHESETALDDVVPDRMVANTTIDHLREQLELIAQLLIEEGEEAYR